MACNCSKKTKYRYTWTSDDGNDIVVYDSEIVARAKVKRAGGTYTKKVAG